MRKFAFLSLLAILIPSMAMAGMCGSSEISLRGLQTASWDEFLYDSAAAYSDAQKVGRGETGRVSGTVYECDADACGNGKYIVMEPGHVWNGNVINGRRLYMCNTASDDQWMEMGHCYVGRQSYNLDDEVKNVTNDECRNTYHVDQTDQYAATFTAVCDLMDNQKGTEWKCVAQSCKSGYRLDARSRVCVPDGTPTPTPQPDPVVNRGETCAFLGIDVADGNWYVDLSQGVSLTPTPITDLRNCEGLAGYDANAIEYHAKCNSGAMECVVTKCHPDYNLTDGKCMAKGTNVDPTPNPTPDSNQCEKRCATLSGNVKNNCIACCHVTTSVATWQNNMCKCANNGTFTPNTDPKTGGTCVGGTVNPVNNNPPAPTPNPTPNLAGTISGAIANLNKISSEFTTSKWKNSEGQFNTARLASDAIAGVVLGTAGGLITSSVVKKNQVKRGFEDISCTVGGQVVADWDDQFSVGIR